MSLCESPVLQRPMLTLDLRGGCGEALGELESPTQLQHCDSPTMVWPPTPVLDDYCLSSPNSLAQLRLGKEHISPQFLLSLPSFPSTDGVHEQQWCSPGEMMLPALTETWCQSSASATGICTQTVAAKASSACSTGTPGCTTPNTPSTEGLAPLALDVMGLQVPFGDDSEKPKRKRRQRQDKTRGPLVRRTYGDLASLSER